MVFYVHRCELKSASKKYVIFFCRGLAECFLCLSVYARHATPRVLLAGPMRQLDLVNLKS